MSLVVPLLATISFFSTFHSHLLSDIYFVCDNSCQLVQFMLFNAISISCFIASDHWNDFSFVSQFNWLCEFIAFVLGIRIRYCLEFWTSLPSRTYHSMWRIRRFSIPKWEFYNHFWNTIPLLSFMLRHFWINLTTKTTQTDRNTLWS